MNKLILLTILMAMPAYATKPEPPKPPPEPEVTQRQDQRQSSYSDSSATGGSSDNMVAVSNVYMSRAFAQDFPITHGCFIGLNAGGDETTKMKSTGGFLGFTYLSNSCHMQTLAAAEKDVEIVARLQCGDRKYRKAVAFDNPRGVSKREHCIAIKRQSLMGAIEVERQRLINIADQHKHDNAVNK